MKKQEYKKIQKDDKPVLAICYDFDKTLSPDDMQAQGYIQKVGYEKADDFWKKSNDLAEKNEMDQNLAYMFMMKEEAEGQLVFNRKTLQDYGAKVELFPGVEEWFDRINAYGLEHGVFVEHYIISSGLREMIDGTSIAKYFKKIYASSFYYNAKGVAQWPAQAVNYTNKTQFLFRIEKGTLEINDESVNNYYPPSKIRIPFRNMIYIGDSDTDIPCMKLINSFGGHAIGVYNPKTNDKTKVYKMIKDNRIKYFTAADYSDGCELDNLVKGIIKKTVENERLEQLHYNCEEESENYYDTSCDDRNEIDELINKLDESKNFKTTHRIIKELSKFEKISTQQCEKLMNIAINNHPVRYIINDLDVNSFYKKVLIRSNNISLKKRVKNLMETKV